MIYSEAVTPEEEGTQAECEAKKALVPGAGGELQLQRKGTNPQPLPTPRWAEELRGQLSGGRVQWPSRTGQAPECHRGSEPRVTPRHSPQDGADTDEPWRGHGPMGAPCTVGCGRCGKQCGGSRMSSWPSVPCLGVFPGEWRAGSP